MWGGHTGPGAKTIVPREAHAKVTFRLVAHQEPADVAAALREYVAAHTPPGIEATVTFGGPGVRPCLSPLHAPAVQAAKQSMERAFGKEVLFTREGGSGPEADLADILGAPLVFVAVGLDEDRIHAPNEKVEMDLLLQGGGGGRLPVGRAGRAGAPPATARLGVRPGRGGAPAGRPTLRRVSAAGPRGRPRTTRRSWAASCWPGARWTG